MFSFFKKAHPKTIILSSHTVLTGEELSVNSLWQQRHATSNLAHIMGQAINTTDESLDRALRHYMSTRALPLTVHQPIHDFTFTESGGVSGTLSHHGEAYQLAIKGMPEHILEYCDMSDNEREVVTMQMQAMSSQGLSVIALASGIILRPIKDIRKLKKDERLSLTGLIGLKLGVSSRARQCVTEAATQGISLYLCTGLHPTAAYSLANQIGLATQPRDVYDARHLDVVRPEELITLIASTNIFARAQKTERSRIQTAIRTIDETAVTATTIEDFEKLLGK
jgi:magnesium-transporting ATPase (P-type)